MRRVLRIWLGLLLVSGCTIACRSSPHSDSHDRSHRGPARTEPPAPASGAVLEALASALPPIPRSIPPSAPSTAASTERPPPDVALSPSDPWLDAARTRGDYTLVEHPPFSVLLPASETSALAPYLTALLDRAAEVFTERYGALHSPLRVDVYSDQRAYRARLGGRLPFDVEGAYEANAIVMLSPRAGAGNWGQTLYHELSHAFQDAACDGPLDRWLAEGLAELDTRTERVEWRRELAGSAEALLADPRPGFLARLEHALRAPRTERELGDAYYVATELVGFIVEHHGAESPRAMLETSTRGARDDTPSAARVLAGTGLTIDELERAFLAALPQLVGANGRGGARVPELVSTHPPGVPSLETRAVEALIERRLEGARRAADAALSADASSRIALYVRARVAILEGDVGAERWLERLVAAGDAYEARIGLARAALLRNDIARARDHAEAALRLEPAGREAWDLRLRLADRGARGVDRRASRRMVVDLDERAADLGFSLVRDAAAESDWQTVRTYGERLLYVDPARVELHQGLALAYDALGESALARRERAVIASFGPQRP